MTGRIVDAGGHHWPVTGHACNVCGWPLDPVHAELGTHPSCDPLSSGPAPYDWHTQPGHMNIIFMGEPLIDIEDTPGPDESDDGDDWTPADDDDEDDDERHPPHY